MRHRTAGLDHQAGSLLPELRGVLLTLARHTDNLPAGPAVPPVRCPPSRVNPTVLTQKSWRRRRSRARSSARACVVLPRFAELLAARHSLRCNRTARRRSPGVVNTWSSNSPALVATATATPRSTPLWYQAGHAQPASLSRPRPEATQTNARPPG